MGKRRLVWMGSVLLLEALGIGLLIIYGGGRPEHAGTPTAARVSAVEVAERAARQAVSAADRHESKKDKQILFGDLHVHSTFSGDAFLRSLPMLGGEGAHPPADACDFARQCSRLDFFAMTDHAEGLTPRHWKETKELVRQCNAVAGDERDPDLVAFTGFEWSQVGPTPEQHYGHKNVIFRDTDEAHLPARPIAAPWLGRAFRSMRAAGGSAFDLVKVPLLEFSRRQRYLDVATYLRENQSVVDCPKDVPTRELPPDCREYANTPHELFDKLQQWGFASLVIPHGTTWGFYTPPGYTWDKQLAKSEQDERQRLIEVYSGHGNSEEYRSFRAVEKKPDGTLGCPEPTEKFEPCCWRAGEIIRERCDDPKSAECERRVDKARADFVAAGSAGHLSIPGASVADWKDCDQCRDCFNPTYNQRPGGSAQYLLARGNFDDPKQPEYATFGFIASSDNHTARPGTGYKEFERRKMTEATGAKSAEWRQRFFPEKKKTPASVSLVREEIMALPPFQVAFVEPQASFFMTGGLVAVHATGRDRGAIWDALQRREVYGTSGERILLWFDLVDGDQRLPMGSVVTRSAAPHFEVRALGAFVQQPGCPDSAKAALGEERLARLCLGQCYQPGDRRRAWPGA